MIAPTAVKPVQQQTLIDRCFIVYIASRKPEQHLELATKSFHIGEKDGRTVVFPTFLPFCSASALN